tara:strand:+ start:8863 stop:9918 length:1056 start_codon:yes stop_codon:yes gene_type:complete
LNKKYSKHWKNIILSPESSIREAANNLEKHSFQIVLIADKKNRLLGTISDGDIRRGLLSGLELSNSVLSIANLKPRVVPQTVDKRLALQIMHSNKIRQIPIVGKKNEILGIYLWDEFINLKPRENTMIIMAGGKGVRMKPFTDLCPKPMLKVGNKPMLEHIIERAKGEGINNFIISINYLGHIIKDYFGSGKKLGVKIKYLNEKSPLGTAGSLSLLTSVPKKPFLVVNGDVITGIRYGKILDFHLSQESKATMAVSLHEWQHPYGVVNMNGTQITKIEEKPISRNHVNAGVYVLSPEILKLLKKNKFCDMPELFKLIIEKKFRCVAYPVHENWLDVGKPDDYEQAKDYLIE